MAGAMSSYHLIDVVQQLGQPRLLVVGDLILDRYIWGDAERVSQEAPVILLREDQREIRLGGAANVANMVRGLDADVAMVGVVGADADGKCVIESLEAAGVDCAAVLADPTRPTTVKERYLGRAQNRHPHQMLRVDREVRTPIDAGLTQKILDVVLPRLGEFQCVLISDYGKGVCTPEVSQAIIRAAKEKKIPVIVDPSSSGDCRNFVGATAVTPNRLETFRATGREIRSSDDAYFAGKRLCAQFELEYAFVTMDKDGMALVMADGAAQMLPTRKREVYDITGAGDMVLATIGVGAAAGVGPADLGRLANVAGGLEVEQIGVVCISREEILGDLIHGARSTKEKVCRLDEAARHVAARKKLGQRIVMTNGCFDVLHVGHVSYLQQAAAEGDCLVVALNSDSSVRTQNKGPDRPVFSEEHRAAMLAALEAVDYVVVFEEATPHAVLEKLQPHLLVKGGTYTNDQIVGKELVEAYGGQVKALGAVPGMSTTEILKHLRAPGGVTIPLPAPSMIRKAG
jgi:D-beta-D-heptose 7-phosphate kinase/D-beta-D-heptose 1-phosphate adenosyltransferase